MGFTARTATVVENASATSVTGTLPTDRQSGDLALVVFAVVGTPAQFTGPGGSWVQVVAPTDDGASGGQTIAAYRQFTPGSAPTASTSASAGRVTAIMQSWAGVDTTTPIDVTAAVTTGTMALAATGVTTATSGALLLSGTIADTSTRTLVTPSGMTSVAAYSAASTGRALALASEARPTAGASGTRTWDVSPAAAVVAAAFVTALRPAAVTGIGTGALGALAGSATGSSAVPVTGVGTGALGALAGSAVGSSFTVVSGTGTGALGALTGSAAGEVLARFRGFETHVLEFEFEPGVWTDASDALRMPVKIKPGRSTPYDDISPTSIEFDLNDPDGDYRPDNTASAYWPNVIKNVPMRFSVTMDGVEYVRMTGWVQRWRSSWPGSDYRKGRTRVIATDGNGLLGQFRLASNFTETLRWRARTDVCALDVWEPIGEASGLQVELTNLTDDASPAGSNYAYSGSYPNLKFGSDSEISCGKVVTSTPSTEGNSNTTICGFQANPLQIILHFKTPTELADSSYYTIASFQESDGTFVCNIIYTVNGAANGCFLMNANNTTNLGLITNLPRGQWIRIALIQNAGNAAHLDAYVITNGGSAPSVTDAALDVRTIGQVETPGGVSLKAAGSWAGIAAIGTDSVVSYDTSFTGAPGGSISARVTAIGAFADRLPLTIGLVGTGSANVLTGDTSDRYGADVLREIMRSEGGLLWARPRDGNVYGIRPSLVRPDTPVATIDVQEDLDGTPQLDDSTDQTPTRVEVAWPGGSALVIAADAEAFGAQRSKKITTVCESTTAAAAVGALFLAPRTTGNRLQKLRIDLCGSVTNHVPALFSTSATLDGLYPSARLRVAGPGATGLLGNPTVDCHVEGWEEVYSGPGVAWLECDTSPAVASTLASDTFTGSNGASLAAQWVAGVTGTGGTAQIQSNQARISSGTVANAYTARRLDLTARADAEITFGGVTLGSSASTARITVRGNSTLATSGYVLVLDASGTLRLQSLVGGVFTDIATWSQTLAASTAYGVRVRLAGKWLNARVWAASGSEPGTWSGAAVTETVTGTGYWGIGSLGDGTTTPRTVDYDGMALVTMT
jgi:hypothetical protein